MVQPVLAMGCAVLTASGSVWYLPALADLRAGADRPPSRRAAAIACLSGWGTLGVVGLLLLVAPAWWVPGTAAVVGALSTVGLRIHAVARRAVERREVARQWAQLGHDPLPAGGHRSRGAVAALVVCGPLAAAAVAALLPAAGPGDGPDRPVTAVVPLVVVALFLMIAVRHTARLRRPERPARAARSARHEAG
ncbi:hypothetical protein ACFYOV_04635 [Streptomyces sp. NPDC005931]|uniref:hypothetical protein n=1 Tax=Streptomyces sp. NPDC005931 TaxID=3364737 RepID=UPI00368FBF52